MVMKSSFQKIQWPYLHLLMVYWIFMPSYQSCEDLQICLCAAKHVEEGIAMERETGSYHAVLLLPGSKNMSKSGCNCMECIPKWDAKPTDGFGVKLKSKTNQIIINNKTYTHTQIPIILKLTLKSLCRGR